MKVYIAQAFHFNSWEEDMGSMGGTLILDEDDVGERVIAAAEAQDVAVSKAEAYLENHEADEVWGPLKSVSLYVIELGGDEPAEYLGSMDNVASAKWHGPAFERRRKAKAS